MLVLGIDPGVGRLGYALVKKEKTGETLLDCGCIETPANSPLPSRLQTIHLFLKDLIFRHQPDHVAIEDLFFAKNAKTVMAVGAARGVVLLTCSLANIKIFNYTPLQIKSAITGYGQADKKQVEDMVIRLLKLKEIPKLDDTVDAIAAALTHLASHRDVTMKK
jgi:crossover junction endodeoxyribonuclease RuvC